MSRLLVRAAYEGGIHWSEGNAEVAQGPKQTSRKNTSQAAEYRTPGTSAELSPAQAPTQRHKSGETTGAALRASVTWYLTRSCSIGCSQRQHPPGDVHARTTGMRSSTRRWLDVAGASLRAMAGHIARQDGRRDSMPRLPPEATPDTASYRAGRVTNRVQRRNQAGADRS
jgi:hypothetical protein